MINKQVFKTAPMIFFFPINSRVHIFIIFNYSLYSEFLNNSYSLHNDSYQTTQPFSEYKQKSSEYFTSFFDGLSSYEH